MAMPSSRIPPEPGSAQVWRQLDADSPATGHRGGRPDGFQLGQDAVRVFSTGVR